MDKTIDMARESGMVYREFEDEFANANTDGVDLETLKAFEALVRADEREQALAAPTVQEPVAIDGNTSDGYHTFNELYEFRKAYNAALFNEWAAASKCSVHKSWRHHDGELCFGGGWFIVVAVLLDGQISNHYEAKDWDLFVVPETERALFEFDGHTGRDVVARLKAYTTSPAAQPAPVQCWKCGDMDADFQANCKVPACGMKEDAAQPSTEESSEVQPAPVQEPVAFDFQKALRRAYHLGQNYWADADSESYSANKRADKHRQDFDALCEEALASTTPPAAQRQWVGLTDEQKLSLEIQGGKSDVMLAELVEGWLKEKNK